MNVLITGCNGFLGLNIARYLSNFSDFKIMGVCRNKSFYSKYFSEVLSVNDLSDLQNLPNIMNKVDILIHSWYC